MVWQRRMLKNRLLFESSQPEACHVAILAGVHGDEHAGYYALDRLIARLHREGLRKGRLSLIPGNIVAAARKRPTRCAAGQDLNRLLLEPDEIERAGLIAQGPDWQRAQELMTLLRDVDFLLDLHSTSAPCEPFAIIQHIETSLPLLAGFPVDLVDYGYGQVFPGSTMAWVERCGGVGISVECGEHRHASTRGAKVAFASILALLRNVGMLKSGPAPVRMPTRFRRIVHRGLIQHAASLRYEPWFKSDVRVEYGQLVAHDRTREYHAPTREQVAQSLNDQALPDSLTAIMVTPAARVAKVRPHDAFLLGIPKGPTLT